MRRCNLPAELRPPKVHTVHICTCSPRNLLQGRQTDYFQYQRRPNSGCFRARNLEGSRRQLLLQGTWRLASLGARTRAELREAAAIQWPWIIIFFGIIVNSVSQPLALSGMPLCSQNTLPAPLLPSKLTSKRLQAKVFPIACHDVPDICFRHVCLETRKQANLSEIKLDLICTLFCEPFFLNN